MGQDFLYALSDWYQPQFHTMIYSSFNEDPVTPTFNISNPDFGKTDFAVSSIPKLKLSIHRYIKKNDYDGIFFRYSPIYPQDLGIRVLGGVDYKQNEDKHYLFGYKGLKLQGQINKDFSINGYWWAGQFRGDKYYYLTSPLVDSYIQPDDNVTYLDNLQGAIKYDRENFQVVIGRGKYQVGDNISGSIILNNATNDYGYMSSKLRFGTLALSYLHGALTPDNNEIVYYSSNSVEPIDSSRVDKFIVLHKLDWTPSQSFSGFIGEEIIYGNRGFDLNYLVPHAFWRIIEHNLEDRDNVLIFGGFKWKMNPDFTFYENTLFDEFSQSKILTDWWGSKYAIQVGISYFHRDSRRIALSDDCFPRFTLEMTAVRPWTYTHFVRWNKFSNDNIALGYPVGSNCINYSFQANHTIQARLLLALNASYSRQGSVGNRFDLNTNDPNQIPDQVNTKTKWLAGTITDTARFKIMAEWHPLEHHFIRLGTTISKIDESEWTQDLAISYRTEF